MLSKCSSNAHLSLPVQFQGQKSMVSATSRLKHSAGFLALYIFTVCRFPYYCPALGIMPEMSWILFLLLFQFSDLIILICCLQLLAMLTVWHEPCKQVHPFCQALAIITTNLHVV